MSQLDHFASFLSSSMSSLVAQRPRDCVFGMAARGDHEALGEELRPHGFVDANEELTQGLRMLHLACYFGQERVVRLLLKRGATDSRAGAHPYRFWTALHFACHSGNVACLRALKPTWDRLQRRDTYNVACIHIACYAGHTEIIDEMLELAPNDHAKSKLLNEEGHVTAGDSFGHTPLDEACSGRQWATMKLLLARGATYLHTKRLAHDLVKAEAPAKTLDEPPEPEAKRPKVMTHFGSPTTDDAKAPSCDKDSNPPSSSLTSAAQDERHSATDDPLVWHRKFEELAKLAIASGVNRDQVDLIRINPVF